MGKGISFEGLGGDVVLFFCRNHDEELSTEDIAEKFGVPHRSVPERLSWWVRREWLSHAGRRGPGKMDVYTAGPKLLMKIGVAITACAPAANVRAPAGGL